MLLIRDDAGSMMPRHPTPIPRSGSFACFSDEWTKARNASILLGDNAWKHSSRSPSEPTTAALIAVPPISTPSAYAISGESESFRVTVIVHYTEGMQSYVPLVRWRLYPQIAFPSQILRIIGA
jgi:hypothetical protein